MDFVKKEWQFRDIITEGELNRIEEGVEEGITKAEAAQQAADNAQATADEANQKADQNAADLIAHLNDFASKNQFGHVKIGAGLDVQEGVISNGIKSIYGFGTRAAGLAGDQDFVVGFRPRILIIIANQTTLPGVGSWGFASYSSQSGSFGGGISYQHLRIENYFGFSDLIFLDYGGNNHFKATLKSWNDNGFTLEWETIGTAIEGQVNIRFLTVGW